MKWLASIGLSGTVLALFAAITSVAIGWTYLGTKAQIDFEVRRAEARQLLEIFPPDTHDNEIVDDVFEVAAETALLGIRERRQGYRVRRGNTVVGVILPATARDGYSGDIRALVGVRRDGHLGAHPPARGYHRCTRPGRWRAGSRQQQYFLASPDNPDGVL